MNFEIKPVTSQSELDQVMSVRFQVFVEEQKVPLSLEIDEWEETATHFLARAAGKPAGAARFRFLSDGIGKVERVAVLSSHRGTGMGRALMNAVEEFASNHGVTMIKLHAQIQALPFYRKLGYQAEGEPFIDAGIQHREMKKPILS
ncbi:putative acetyltransferase [Kroppenstedtia guangzhouensis]|uniref:Acetyltransferase n=1 Tax=Kroppenstedtia guangzhouensis TaxID=1274356 RepID=A0ABQ1FV68_9BACL|nr:GNAT family N-acetyltransferase [Kroppenstedtia guangzhouensis]GGA31692.1 putative acetyltransferase [Kroppenstedtia guangzhouensis]